MLNKDNIIDIIRNDKILTLEQSFSFARQCMSFIDSTEDEDKEYGRRIIINVLDNWAKVHRETHDMWTNIIESAGFYPYIDHNHLTLSNFSAEIRKGLSTSENIKDKCFHDKQKEIVDILHTGRNVIASAPTSFGKSLIIEEIIASNKYKSIVVIQPTLALLGETRKKLYKYKDQYKLIVTTTQEPSTIKSNIFLFTAERVCEYSHFSNVDFLIIDEFYKLSGSRDDERSSALNNAFYKILRKYYPQFYLLGPNIDAISDGFAEKYGAIFYKSNYSLVDSNAHDVYSSNSKEKTKDREKRLFELLLSLSNQQTIIYCSSPDRVRTLSRKFYEYIKSNNKEISLPIIEWIEENISKTWSLINVLKNSIGIHDAALQKHITTSIIDYFNDNRLKYLFCTSTIIEGVNTSARNIIYYDTKKGRNIPIDYFDYSNIKGRAGRMMVHYTGNVYNFNSPPPKENIVVDIPFFQQNPIKDEVLIQLDDKNVKNKESQQYKDIANISPLEKEVIAKNGLSVKGQLNILAQLRTDIISKQHLICWSGIKPKKIYIEYVLDLAWKNLLLESESTTVSFNQLVFLTHSYGVWETSIATLILNSVNHSIKEYKERNKCSSIEPEVISEFENKAIKLILQVVRHWFEYKVPKWLSTVNSLQELVCKEKGIQPGDYSSFASIVENNFIPEHLTLLAEYGVPHSAIKKLANEVPSTIGDDELIGYIKRGNLHRTSSLIEYERDKIAQLF